MSEPQSPRELLERWRAGDQSAADALYRRYAQRLCALAEKNIGERLARRVDPEDIVQSVFRTFFRRTREGQYPIDHSSSLWWLLVRVTLKKVQKQVEYHRALRRNLRSEAYAVDDSLSPELLAHDPTPAEAAALADELQAVVAGLEPIEVKMLNLCVSGYSTSEIAVEVGCSRWTVRRTLDFIGQRIQKRMDTDRDD